MNVFQKINFFCQQDGVSFHQTTQITDKQVNNEYLLSSDRYA